MDLSWHNTGKGLIFSKSYCYPPGVSVRVGVSVGVRMQNVRANVKVLEFKSFCIFSCILTLLIILIKPLTIKAYDRRASGDCGTSGVVFDLLLIELLPFAKILFSWLSSFCLVILAWHFGIWNCLDIIQVKFDYYCVWPDCTPDIFFCLNLVFCTFLCRLARYWHQIWGMNLFWPNTEHFSLLYPFMYSFWS